MFIFDDLTISNEKKLLTRNRFRDFYHIVNIRLLSIFTGWSVNLLLKQIKFTVII